MNPYLSPQSSGDKVERELISGFTVIGNHRVEFKIINLATGVVLVDGKEIYRKFSLRLTDVIRFKIENLEICIKIKTTWNLCVRGYIFVNNKLIIDDFLVKEGREYMAKELLGRQTMAIIAIVAAMLLCKFIIAFICK